LGIKDTRVDAYIAKSAEFAKPILSHVRKLDSRHVPCSGRNDEVVKEAKTEETRKSRLATAIEWMSEGKIRNWKYVKE